MHRSQIPISMIIWVASFANSSAECNPRDFMIQDTSSIQQSLETQVAFVLTATEEEYNTSKQSGALSGAYGPISGAASFSDAKEAARRVAEAIKFDYRTSYASSYFSQKMSPAALASYGICMERDKERPGLALWLQDRQGDFLTLKSYWVGADTNLAAASWDSEPIVDGGRVVSKPDAWIKARTEEIVIRRDGNVDVFLSIKVGGASKSYVVVKDPPNVTWRTKPVISQTALRAASHGPNPGCSAGAAEQCIHASEPGGVLEAGSAAITERTTTDPTRYSSRITVNSPGKICMEITQSTGACEVVQSASGRVSAMERYPTVEE
ncbi:hypothetical protein [Rhizobium ruizarguesonis]|uniref:hypothetical protein n=1 Tax=Rhizobium ruizarguesonis TaxID=2081791 RepID=UPI00103087CA|nr:hypothetical protein [Rhizobium ruizarguesonis]NEI26816.1 hypothetical protein [Rhizobium ruizarguesonis]TBB95497.1 hypothetical protein ELH38_26730 [Rhizobium ruizarguesonis]